MKEPRKKTKGVSKIKADENFDKCIEELADVIVEDAKEHHYSELEPFESYAAKVKSKVHANMEEFRTRFAKGYKILLDELEKKPSDHKEESHRPNSIKP